MTLYAHGVDLLRHPDADLGQNRLWPAYQHPDCRGDSEPHGTMAVLGPERFHRWTLMDHDSATLLYTWAQMQVESDTFPICPWPGSPTHPKPRYWHLMSVTWDEGYLRISAMRKPIRPTLHHPMQYHHWTWSGPRGVPTPPCWPWSCP